MPLLRFINTKDLRIAYEERGDAAGPVIILMHGFPYDIRTYDEVATILSNSGCRVLTPYLRGYGPTTFLSASTMRSGQQAALANDLREFMDALSIQQAILGGYDWGGRACCIVAALYPEQVKGLVSMSGYNIQHFEQFSLPDLPEIEMLNWYQYYFHSDRGRLGLTKYRNELCKLLWQHWSPTWKFSDETFSATAASFNNPDFVEIVVHSYRHRYGLANGDPRFESMEQALQLRPPVKVPAIILDPEDDGVEPIAGTGKDSAMFIGGYDRLIIKGAGHNLPQEAPQAFADAVLALR